jgi:hypothetical protein
MGRRRKLKGVAHDIAHHAASGLSYISPYMARGLREAGLDTTVIDLLHTSPYPAGVAECNPLRLALRALHETAVSILAKQEFLPADITSISLHATPSLGHDDYNLLTRVVIVSASGRTYASNWL